MEGKTQLRAFVASPQVTTEPFDFTAANAVLVPVTLCTPSASWAATPRESL